jgi:hypothetical protein
LVKITRNTNGRWWRARTRYIHITWLDFR